MRKKGNKRILPALALAAMVAFLPVTEVSAVTVTVNGNAKQYQAYKLLDLTTSLKTGDVHDAHDPGAHTEDCYNYSYIVNSKYSTILKTAALSRGGGDSDGDGTVTDKELLDYIGGLNNDAAAVRSYADTVYQAIAADASITADATTPDGSKIFTLADQGYYMIVESQKADDPDAYSLVMLDTAGQDNITIQSKEDTPEVGKKVKLEGEADSAYADAVDAARGQVVEFRLTGGMPKNFSNYSVYKYIFHDTFSQGLAFKELVSVSIDGTVIDASKYTVKTTGTFADGCSLEISFADLKSADLGVTVTKDSSVVVVYKATVTEQAISGNPGNPNDVHLEFSNNPYVTDDTSNTPDDTVKVFQFTVVINKTDGTDPLTGAEFTLYKDGRADGAADPVWQVSAASTKNAEGTVFTFAGLSQGSYKLVESKVPDGYNKADDVYFDIEAEYDTTADDPKITALKIMQNGHEISAGADAKFTLNANLGTATGSVINTTGIRLPSTGEFGRAILLYGGIGAFGVSIVCVVLASRKGKTQGHGKHAR